MFISLILNFILLLTADPVGDKGMAWQACSNPEFKSWFTDTPPEALQCGYISAPLSYGKKIGMGVKLAATRLPAKENRIGSLLTIPGGPGQSGLIQYESVRTGLLKSFDIIGYDPRGIGQSTPAIACPNQDEGNWVDACIKNTGRDVIEHIGSDEATDDVDTIRRALGEKKLSILASSYGTQIAAMYAERYPDKIRAMVLDGVVDISEDETTSVINQGRGYQQAMEIFAFYCAETRGCPLSPRLGEPKTLYQNLLKRLDKEIIVNTDGKRITSADIDRTVTEKLLWSSYWEELVTVLVRVSANKVDKETTRLLAEEIMPDQNNAQMVIQCADTARLQTDAQVLKRERIASVTAQAYGHPTEAQLSNLSSVCDEWPFTGKVRAHVPVISNTLPPLLFVSQQVDPTTPYINAVKMSAYFRSPLLTRKKGLGHTIVLTGEDTCIDNQVMDYLLFPDKARQDASCG